ncbi:uncharacterized protein LOC111087115 [Limulus polyphemus]|uniref:Uncharacterized protein LOC111087115 n=1 Tax=Limulus polyphemus TaxID=6850 RepID=A0ABM1SXF1_LIMPO|nr:uncharacterized protein LOC111087115 [Limulus polyphemus]
MCCLITTWKITDCRPCLGQIVTGRNCRPCLGQTVTRRDCRSSLGQAVTRRNCRPCLGQAVTRSNCRPCLGQAVTRRNWIIIKSFKLYAVFQGYLHLKAQETPSRGFL